MVSSNGITRRDSDWGPSTTRGAAIAIKRVFNWAVEQGLPDTNPIPRIKAPQAQRRDNVITEVEFDEILAKVSDGDPFHDLLVVAWDTGCRPQEIVSVEARHVEASLGRWKFPGKEAKGKHRGDNPPRLVYLSVRALEVTLRLAAQYPTGPLFRNKRGRRWASNAINDRLSRLASLKGARRIALYDLRHSFATRMAGTMDCVDLATLMGHRDVQMLMRVYYHGQAKGQEKRLLNLVRRT
jgi:integrase